MYLTLKALHIISIISWMAGMLYLPRLFVYHATAARGSELSETLKIMERKLARIIMLPAMLASFLFGIWILFLFPEWLREGWLHAKLALVLVMSALHGMLIRDMKRFARDANTKSHRYYRIFNEAVTLAMVGIVLLVVLKPF